MSALFAADAVVEVFNREEVGYRQIVQIEGADAIGNAVAGMMAPHAPLGWSHHTTFDHLVDVVGDDASVDAQYIVYRTQGAHRPADGWPEGMFGAQGTITPIEIGYYRPQLRRIDGVWQITRHQIFHDIPYVVPGA